MTKKNKKWVNNPNPNPRVDGDTPTSIVQANTSQQSTNKPATGTNQNHGVNGKSNSNKPLNQSNSQKSANPSNNQKAFNESNNQTGNHLANHRKSANSGSNNKAQSTNANNKGKVEGANAGKSGAMPLKNPKTPKPIAAPYCHIANTKITRTTHASKEYRLKCSLLFKQETAFFAPDIIETKLLSYKYKESLDTKCVNLELSKNIDQFVAENKFDVIVKTIISVLDNNNPLLINYDILLYSLAKCLYLVRQDPEGKQPSPTILEFRTKILALAVERIAATNAERLLEFVYYLFNFSTKSLHNAAIRLSLTKWYMLKKGEDLALLCAKGSSFKGVNHFVVLKGIHFNLKGVNPDSQLALYAIMYGFKEIASRLVVPPAGEKVPPFLEKVECYTTASDKVKTVIQDVARARSHDSSQKVVAAAVMSLSLTRNAVSSTFFRSYKVNNALMEVSSPRSLLESMHHLRLHNVLSSSDKAEIDDDSHTTVDTFVRRVKVENDATDEKSKEPPLHPMEIFSAYAEYVLAPLKVVEQWSEKKDDKVKPPEPKVIKVLQELYTKSFSSLKQYDLKISVCIDLQKEMEDVCCLDYRPVQGYHECMLLLKCLTSMVTKENIKVVTFEAMKAKAIFRLKKYKPEESETEETKPDLGAGVETTTGEETVEEKPDDEPEDTPVNTRLIMNELDSMWEHYKKQIPHAGGITVHKLFSLALKAHQFLPDVFVVITQYKNLSLYMANAIFSDYVQQSKKTDAKLLIISPCSHLPSARVIHRRNMLHIVGFDPKVTHLIEDFLSNKICVTSDLTAADNIVLK